MHTKPDHWVFVESSANADVSALALGNGKYILASRMREGDEVTTDVLARAGRYQEVRDNLRVKEVIVGDGERRQRYVVCHNPDEATRRRKHQEKLVAELEVELASLEHKKGKCTGSA